MTKLKQKIIEILLKGEIKQLNEAVEITEDKITLTSQADKIAQEIIEVVEKETKTYYCDECGKLIKIPTALGKRN